MQAKKSSESFLLTIRGRKGLVMEKQEVFAITSINPQGIFDVLPEHENFISLIKDYIVIHKTKHEKEEIKIDSGIIKVNENSVNIFIGVHSL